MEKIKTVIKKNYIAFLCIFVLIGIICYGFYDYIHMYYGYDYDKVVDTYEKSLKKCNTGEIDDKEYCKNLAYPLSPKEEFELLDAKTLFFEVLYHHCETICFILPLIVMIIFLSIVHKDFSSGMIRNCFMRESLEEYKNKINKKILKVSFLIPLCIFLIFIVSCILTGFNFKVDSSVYDISVYVKWNYDNMFLYLILNYITIVFMSVFYCNIACCFINKNKNLFIVAIISYITWFILVFLFSSLPLITTSDFWVNRYFNILDYWHYYDTLSKCWFGFILSALILAISSFVIRECVFRNKERIIIENEKGII